MASKVLAPLGLPVPPWSAWAEIGLPKTVDTAVLTISVCRAQHHELPGWLGYVEGDASTHACSLGCTTSIASPETDPYIGIYTAAFGLYLHLGVQRASLFPVPL